MLYIIICQYTFACLGSESQHVTKDRTLFVRQLQRYIHLLLIPWFCDLLVGFGKFCCFGCKICILCIRSVLIMVLRLKGFWQIIVSKEMLSVPRPEALVKLSHGVLFLPAGIPSLIHGSRKAILVHAEFVVEIDNSWRRFAFQISPRSSSFVSHSISSCAVCLFCCSVAFSCS